MRIEEPMVDSGDDDWPQYNRWDLWHVNTVTQERSLVTTLVQLFDVMGIQNDKNVHKLQALQAFVVLPVAQVMPADLRKEVDDFITAVGPEAEV